MRKCKEYAIYKGDKFIDIGTAKELAEKYNYRVNTIYEATCWDGRKRYDKSALIAVPLENEVE